MSTEKRKIGPVTTGAGTGVGVAGAAALVLVYVIESVSGVDIPGTVEGAIAVLLAFGGALVGGFLVRPGTGKRVAHDDG